VILSDWLTLRVIGQYVRLVSTVRESAMFMLKNGPKISINS